MIVYLMDGITGSTVFHTQEGIFFWSTLTGGFGWGLLKAAFSLRWPLSASNYPVTRPGHGVICLM
ncbi:MAG: hypothetical protein HN873_11170 [Chloroflexi bacterium]|nr:hypothetical protein [Chloroflexota bacterium]